MVVGRQEGGEGQGGERRRAGIREGWGRGTGRRGEQGRGGQEAEKGGEEGQGDVGAEEGGVSGEVKSGRGSHILPGSLARGCLAAPLEGRRAARRRQRIDWLGRGRWVGWVDEALEVDVLVGWAGVSCSQRAGDARANPSERPFVGWRVAPGCCCIFVVRSAVGGLFGPLRCHIGGRLGLWVLGLTGEGTPASSRRLRRSCGP